MAKLQSLKSKVQTLESRIQRQGAGVTIERLRGCRGVARRTKWLARHPLCVHCEEAGVTTAAAVVDHIVPLWKGGPDAENNLQSLCGPCHDKKTGQEATERARGC